MSGGRRKSINKQKQQSARVLTNTEHRNCCHIFGFLLLKPGLLRSYMHSFGDIEYLIWKTLMKKLFPKLLLCLHLKLLYSWQPQFSLSLSPQWDHIILDSLLWKVFSLFNISWAKQRLTDPLGHLFQVHFLSLI